MGSVVNEDVESVVDGCFEKLDGFNLKQVIEAIEDPGTSESS